MTFQLLESQLDEAAQSRLLWLEVCDSSTLGVAQFELSLDAIELSEGICLRMQHNSDLFDAGWVERLLANFQALLEAVVADPTQPISALPVVSAAERQQIVVQWNDTAAPFPRDRCLHELFEAQARRSPEAIALIDGDRVVTYAELDSLSNRVAQRLRAAAVGRDVPVGVLLDRSAVTVAAMLGVMKAGGAAVPLDPLISVRRRISAMLEDCQAPVLLTNAQLRDLVPTEFGGTVLDAEKIGPAHDVEQFAASDCR